MFPAKATSQEFFAPLCLPWTWLTLHSVNNTMMVCHISLTNFPLSTVFSWCHLQVVTVVHSVVLIHKCVSHFLLFCSTCIFASFWETREHFVFSALVFTWLRFCKAARRYLWAVLRDLLTDVCVFLFQPAVCANFFDYFWDHLFPWEFFMCLQLPVLFSFWDFSWFLLFFNFSRSMLTLALIVSNSLD